MILRLQQQHSDGGVSLCQQFRSDLHLRGQLHIACIQASVSCELCPQSVMGNAAHMTQYNCKLIYETDEVHFLFQWIMLKHVQGM